MKLKPKKEKKSPADGPAEKISVSRSEQFTLEAKDKRYLWHPFTQMKDWQKEEPVIICRGEGVWLEDLKGKRYLDGVSSLWCNVHGHRVPEIDQAVEEQLRQIAHSTF